MSIEHSAATVLAAYAKPEDEATWAQMDRSLAAFAVRLAQVPAWSAIESIARIKDKVMQSVSGASFPGILMKLHNDQINSPRSALQKTAVNLLVTCARALGPQFSSIAADALPALLFLCAKANAVTVRLASAAIEDIIVFCGESVSFFAVVCLKELKKGGSKMSKQMRIVAVLSVASVVSKLMEVVEEVLRISVVDSASEVREASRKLFGAYLERFPQPEKFLASLSTQHLKTLNIKDRSKLPTANKTFGNSSSSIEIPTSPNPAAHPALFSSKNDTIASIRYPPTDAEPWETAMISACDDLDALDFGSEDDKNADANGLLDFETPPIHLNGDSTSLYDYNDTQSYGRNGDIWGEIENFLTAEDVLETNADLTKLVQEIRYLEREEIDHIGQRETELNVVQTVPDQVETTYQNPSLTVSSGTEPTILSVAPSPRQSSVRRSVSGSNGNELMSTHIIRKSSSASVAEPEPTKSSTPVPSERDEDLHVIIIADGMLTLEEEVNQALRPRGAVPFVYDVADENEFEDELELDPAFSWDLDYKKCKPPDGASRESKEFLAAEATFPVVSDSTVLSNSEIPKPSNPVILSPPRYEHITNLPTEDGTKGIVLDNAGNQSDQLLEVNSSNGSSKIDGGISVSLNTLIGSETEIEPSTTHLILPLNTELVTELEGTQSGILPLEYKQELSATAFYSRNEILVENISETIVMGEVDDAAPSEGPRTFEETEFVILESHDEGLEVADFTNSMEVGMNFEIEECDAAQEFTTVCEAEYTIPTPLVLDLKTSQPISNTADGTTDENTSPASTAATVSPIQQLPANKLRNSLLPTSRGRSMSSSRNIVGSGLPRPASITTPMERVNSEPAAGPVMSHSRSERGTSLPRPHSYHAGSLSSIPKMHTPVVSPNLKRPLSTGATLPLSRWEPLPQLQSPPPMRRTRSAVGYYPRSLSMARDRGGVIGESPIPELPPISFVDPAKKYGRAVGVRNARTATASVSMARTGSTSSTSSISNGTVNVRRPTSKLATKRPSTNPGPNGVIGSGTRNIAFVSKDQQGFPTSQKALLVSRGDFSNPVGTVGAKIAQRELSALSPKPAEGSLRSFSAPSRHLAVTIPEVGASAPIGLRKPAARNIPLTPSKLGSRTQPAVTPPLVSSSRVRSKLSLSAMGGKYPIVMCSPKGSGTPLGSRKTSVDTVISVHSTVSSSSATTASMLETKRVTWSPELFTVLGTSDNDNYLHTLRNQLSDAINGGVDSVWQLLELNGGHDAWRLEQVQERLEALVGAVWKDLGASGAKVKPKDGLTVKRGLCIFRSVLEVPGINNGLLLPTDSVTDVLKSVLTCAAVASEMEDSLEIEYEIANTLNTFESKLSLQILLVVLSDILGQISEASATMAHTDTNAKVKSWVTSEQSCYEMLARVLEMALSKSGGGPITSKHLLADTTVDAAAFGGTGTNGDTDWDLLTFHIAEGLEHKHPLTRKAAFDCAVALCKAKGSESELYEQVLLKSGQSRLSMLKGMMARRLR
ncbi:hypothetical protein HDU83_007940 [Entophlyctis luteolus]|nr:hypothetical protein HDU83_007940 [Entophlyctis luteolus]